MYQTAEAQPYMCSQHRKQVSTVGTTLPAVVLLLAWWHPQLPDPGAAMTSVLTQLAAQDRAGLCVLYERPSSCCLRMALSLPWLLSGVSRSRQGQDRL